MKFWLPLLIVLSGISIKNGYADDGEITTADIFKQTSTAFLKNPLGNCFNFRLVGTCFWLSCGWGGCSVKKSLKVSHYLPDIVISTFPDRKKNPWKECRLLDGVFFSGGDKLLRLDFRNLPSNANIDTENVETSTHTPDIKFMEAAVIGNPALSVIKGKLFLKSQARPLKPYHHSGLDIVVWRSSEREMLHPSIGDTRYDIGNGVAYTWGTTYPRSGFVYNPDSAKAAAVIASRAASIATSSNSLHFSTNLDKEPCPNRRCETAGEALVTSAKIKWQRILPIDESTCTDKIATESNPDWVDKAYKGQEKTNGYAWILWRRYKGCLDGDGIFLGDIEW